MNHQWTATVALFFLSTVACIPCPYWDFSDDHSGCKRRNPNCTIVENQITDEEKAMIVKMHNQYRDALAGAKEYSSPDDPEAIEFIPKTYANIRELEWDDELAEIAQRHAETCRGGNDCLECRRVDRFKIVGQTYYQDIYDDDENVWKDFQWKLSYNESSATEIRFADTYKIGCGRVDIEIFTGKRIVSVVCNYGPGMDPDVPFAIKGPPCSKCPSGTCCKDYCSVGTSYYANYPSLCRKDDCKYEKFSSDHIGCRARNPECQPLSKGLSKAERKMILYRLNKYREAVSLGSTFFGQSVPWGKQSVPRGDMRELEWDIELAALAQRHAETCNTNKDCNLCRRVERFEVGQIVFKSEKIKLEEVLKELMPEFGKHEEYYNQIISAETWRLGCGKVVIEPGIFSWNTTIVCNFGPQGDINANILSNNDEERPKSNPVPKENLTPCTNCPQGTCCGVSCVNEGVHSDFKGLCKSIIKEDLSSPLEGVGTCKYYIFSLDHVGCKPRKKDCPITNDKLTKGERRMILHQLNEHRDVVASGGHIASAHKASARALPAAANMRELEWDSELAMLAQKKAETCDEKYDCSECIRVDRFEVGQFIKVVETHDFSIVWNSFMENKYLNQFLWANTWRVGCGKVQLTSGELKRTIIVCHFGPAGDKEFLDFRIDTREPYLSTQKGEITHPDYKIRDICSECPPDTCCGKHGRLCEEFKIHTSYKALCKTMVKDALATSVEDMKKCEYKKLYPEHVGCEQRNATCNIIDDRLTEDQKRLILTVHNEHRSHSAMGKITKAGAWQSTATSMRQMVWDNELADLAQIQAETCSHIFDDCPDCRKVDRFDYVGQIRYRTESTDFQSVMENMPQNLPVEDEFQLRLNITWRVGCGKIVYKKNEKEIDGTMVIICNYGPSKKDLTEENIFNRGYECTECPNGTCCGSLCGSFGVQADYEGLCKSNLVDTPGFDIELDKCRYGKFHLNHASCKPRNLKCNIIDNYLKESDQEEILRLLNDFRHRVALDTVEDGPRYASNMWEMEWDEELAYVAQKHAETCNAEYDCFECRKVDRFAVNQIIYKADYPQNGLWEHMIDAYLTNNDHLLQVINANSWRIGCGKVVFVEDPHNQILVVCNFGPDAIYKWKINSEPYLYGPTCENCPSGTCCGDKCEEKGVKTDYEGLCKSMSDKKWSEPETDFAVRCTFYAPEDSLTESLAEVSGYAPCKFAIAGETTLSDVNTTGPDYVECSPYNTTDNSYECSFPNIVETTTGVFLAAEAKVDFEHLAYRISISKKVTEKL